jgi:hypothetical protein
VQAAALWGTRSMCVLFGHDVVGEGAVPVGDLIYVGIAFVFLGLCLLYVRAADKL